MARVAITKEQELKQRVKDITKQTKLALYDAGIKKKDVAAVAGVDPSAITHQFNDGQITMSVYLAAQMLLETK